MLTGGVVHALTSAFTTFFGWLMDLVPQVPWWVTGGASQIHWVFEQAAQLETWIPVVEATSVASDVAAVWAAAALISWGRLAYSAITNRNA